MKNRQVKGHMLYIGNKKLIYVRKSVCLNHLLLTLFDYRGNMLLNTISEHLSKKLAILDPNNGIGM